MRLTLLISIIAVWGCGGEANDASPASKLDCANPLVNRIDYVMSPVGQPHDPAAAARAHFGTSMRPHDRIVTVAGTEPPVAIVMRRSRAVAKVTLARAEDGGLYASEVAVCRGEGFP